MLGALLLTVVLGGCQTSVDPISASLLLKFNYKGASAAADSLYPIYPNPYSRGSDTTIFITFSKFDSGATTIVIQNPIGDAVATYSDTLVSPGIYSASWNPVTSTGDPLNSGLYFVTLHTGTYIRSRLISILTND